MKPEYIKKISNELIGMDGGNVNSKLWFCGLEWGDGSGNNSQQNDNETSNLPKLPNPPTYNHEKSKRNIPHINDNWIEVAESTTKFIVTKPQYDQKIAKLILLWKGEQWKDIKLPKYNHYHDYMRHCLHFENGDIFKLNLYPQAKDTLATWKIAGIQTETGCITSVEYYAACMQYRFPLLKELSDTFNPEIIICTGKDRMEEFISAFWGNTVFWNSDGTFNAIRRDDKKQLSNGNTVDIYKSNKPILIGIPFPGRPGQLQKDDDLKIIADLIREKLNPQ